MSTGIWGSCRLLVMSSCIHQIQTCNIFGLHDVIALWKHFHSENISDHNILPLWWRISLLIRVQTTLSHTRFVKVIHSLSWWSMKGFRWNNFIALVCNSVWRQGWWTRIFGNWYDREINRYSLIKCWCLWKFSLASPRITLGKVSEIAPKLVGNLMILC